MSTILLLLTHTHAFAGHGGFGFLWEVLRVHICTTADRFCGATLRCWARRFIFSSLSCRCLWPLISLQSQVYLFDLPMHHSTRRNNLYRTSHQLHAHLRNWCVCVCVCFCVCRPGPRGSLTSILPDGGVEKREIEGGNWRHWAGHASPWVEYCELPVAGSLSRRLNWSLPSSLDWATKKKKIWGWRRCLLEEIPHSK